MSEVVDAINHAMNNDIYRMNVTSHNLSNVNTPGYKTEVSTFSIYTDVHIDQNYAHDTAKALRGSERVISQGALKYTGNDFDLALEGSGFFLVNQEGREYAKRTLAMNIDASGKLRTTDGYAVQGQSGDIYLQYGPFVIDSRGAVIQNEREVARIKVVELNELQPSDYLGNGMFGTQNGYHEITDNKNSFVKQKYVETSNVNTMSEMVEIIEATRHFETSSQVLKGYDEMLNSTINILADF